jgi:hypothetical protein
MNTEKTDNLELMMISQYQTGSFIALNSNFNRLDCILNNSLKGDIFNGENTPPSNPDEFLYLVGENPISQWDGDSSYSRRRMIAKSNNGNGWIFIKPKDGLILWHKDNKKLYVYSEGRFIEK